MKTTSPLVLCIRLHQDLLVLPILQFRCCFLFEIHVTQIYFVLVAAAHAA